MKKMMVAGAFAVAVGLALGGSAQADETGVAGIHSWVRSGGKTCLADHYHDGSGTGSTRGGAQASAIRSWIDFTAWEYGSSWARFGLAASKSVSCSGSSGSYSCQVSGRPCRGW